jgi:hypothetical protein
MVNEGTQKTARVFPGFGNSKKRNIIFNKIKILS